ncbi:MAG: fused MFS/spermidine synthase [Planctomycetes bacterium]|nr:fused MFS/spermidine synthase [Planctomycetota bacterium]
MTEAFAAGEIRRSILRDKLVPNTLVFLSSLCIMVVEIVAGRLIAGYLGSSIYTWTSVIAVVLAGIAIGNWLGGKFADAFHPGNVLPFLFAIASILCLATLSLNQIAYHRGEDWVRAALQFINADLVKSMWPFRVLFSVAIVFLWPSLALGTISPVVAKMAIARTRRTGNAVGNIYAWGAVGSIVGTLVAGFVLLDRFGCRTIVILVSAVLAFLAVACALAAIGRTRGTRGGDVLFLLLGLGPITLLALTMASAAMVAAGAKDPNIARWAAEHGLREPLDRKAIPTEEGDEYFRESKYYTIRVYDDTEDGVDVRVVQLDHLIHSYVDPDSPTHIVYDYEEIYAAITQRFARGKDTISAFFLGGGGYTFPRYLNVVFEKPAIDVAEIDPEVTRAARYAQGLDPSSPDLTIPGVREIFHFDGRVTVARLRGQRTYDFIYGDAFNDLSIPAHLTTAEFCASLRDLLAPDGVYLANVIDYWNPGRFLGAYVKTLQSAFGEDRVRIVATEPVADDGRRETFVIVASRRPIEGLLVDLPLEIPDGDCVPYAVTDDEMRALLDRSGHLILTDDYAPVDNLMIPVVRGRSN